MLCRLIAVFIVVAIVTRPQTEEAWAALDTGSLPLPSSEVQSDTSTAARALPDSPVDDSNFLEPIDAVRAIYPPGAEKDKLDGEVVIKVNVSEAGDVEQAEVVSGNSILAAAALDAARKWKFKPFIRNGKLVKISTNLTFNFSLNQGFTDLKIKPLPAIPISTGIQPLVAARMPIRVGAGVTQGMIIRRVAPVYPRDAKRARIQGTVVLAAIIGKGGKIKNLQVVSGPPALVDAAVDAVQQWQYRPYVLQGEPVEVDTQITVNFNLR